MSAVPAETASMPADEPKSRDEHLVSGCASWKASAASSAIGRIVVEPLTMSLSDGPASRANSRPSAEASAASMQSSARRARDDAGERRVATRDARPRRGTRRTGRWPRRCTSRGVRCCTERLLHDSRLAVTTASRSSPPDSARATVPKRVNELRHDFVTHFVVARADVRTDVGHHVPGISTACRAQRVDRPPRQRRESAPPSRVHDATTGPGATRTTGTQSAKHSVIGVMRTAVMSASVPFERTGPLAPRSAPRPALLCRQPRRSRSPWTCSAIVRRSRHSPRPSASSSADSVLIDRTWIVADVRGEIEGREGRRRCCRHYAR